MANKPLVIQFFEGAIVAAKNLLKLVGALAVPVGVLLFAPFFDRLAKVYTDIALAVQGAVFFDVDVIGKPTGGDYESQMALLRPGEASFERVRWGDVLQAQETQFLRDIASAPRDDDGQTTYSKSRQLFTMRPGNCVAVVSKLNDRSISTAPKSGGWLRVATSACGIFN